MKQGGHGGNVYKASKTLGINLKDVHDYSSNVSPFQAEVLKGVDLMELTSRLPEPHSETLVQEYSNKYALEDGAVCVTSGTTEAIDKLCQLYTGKRALIVVPTYSDYSHYASVHNLEINYFYLSADTNFTLQPDKFSCDTDICFICNPNNPTGKAILKDDLLRLCRSNRRTLFFVIDESYIRFLRQPEDHSLIGISEDNLVILRSYSKTYGLPGLRMGGVVISSNLKLIADVKRLISEWSVNCFAQQAGLELLTADVSGSMDMIHQIKKMSLFKRFRN